MAQGAYVLADAPGGTPEVILIVPAAKCLLPRRAREARQDGIKSRVVSIRRGICSTADGLEYRRLGATAVGHRARGRGTGLCSRWERYVGFGGRVIGMQTFGASRHSGAAAEVSGSNPIRFAAAAKALVR